jgi:hypothetical protein
MTFRADGNARLVSLRMATHSFSSRCECDARARRPHAITWRHSDRRRPSFGFGVTAFLGERRQRFCVAARGMCTPSRQPWFRRRVGPRRTSWPRPSGRQTRAARHHCRRRAWRERSCRLRATRPGRRHRVVAEAEACWKPALRRMRSSARNAVGRCKQPSRQRPSRCRTTPEGVTATWWPLRCKFGSARAGAESPLQPLAGRASRLAPGASGRARSGGGSGSWGKRRHARTVATSRAAICRGRVLLCAQQGFASQSGGRQDVEHPVRVHRALLGPPKMPTESVACGRPVRGAAAGRYRP